MNGEMRCCVERRHYPYALIAYSFTYLLHVRRPETPPRGIVIDKLDLRIPQTAPFNPQFGDLYARLRNDSKNDPFRAGKHYLLVGDMRPFGYDVMLHICCKHGKAANHKLELLETGRKTFAQLVKEVENIFAVDPLLLEPMRVDLAVDVKDVPVSFFQDTVWAAYKRVTADVEDASRFVRMGKGEVETLYLGRKPNQFRIYNKIAEVKKKYAAYLRRVECAAAIPTCEELFGYPEEGPVVTRVERQYGGGRIPEELGLLAVLRNRIHFLNPFVPLEFLSGGVAEPNPDDYDAMTYAAGIGIRKIIEERGMHRTRQLLNRQSRGNAARILRKLFDFLPVASSACVPDLGKLFEESITRQVHPHERIPVI